MEPRDRLAPLGREVLGADVSLDPDGVASETTDHPKGVWTLPPTYALGDVDRAKYEAIEESDRMTLKFVKLSPPYTKRTAI
jgi:predicted methyltransferase